MAIGGDFVSVGGHQGGKTAKNGLGGSSSGASANHSHGDSGHAHSSLASRVLGPNNTCAAGPNFGFFYDQGTNTGWASIGGQSADHSHTISVSGDNETRPVNRGVRYIIKV